MTILEQMIAYDAMDGDFMTYDQQIKAASDGTISIVDLVTSTIEFTHRDKLELEKDYVY